MEPVFSSRRFEGGKAYIELQEEIAHRKRLEEKLSFLEEYNRHLVESAGACIMLVNDEGEILSLNRRARELLEIQEDKICLGLQWTSLFQDLDAKAIPTVVNARMNSTFQASSKTQSGNQKYWNFTFSS